jgi:thioesterase domain-containing protein
MADFVKKVWCTFVLMSDDPWFIINYRTTSMRKKTISFFKSVGLYKKNKDPNDFYVYSEMIIKKMLIAARDYKLTPYDGKVDLFRAKRKTYYLPDFEYLGWKPFALRGVNIHEVPGEHAEIFNPPNVEELAKVLQACLDRANGLDVNPKVSFLRAV